MKLRNGFVSNSSSSSFIVIADKMENFIISVEDDYGSYSAREHVRSVAELLLNRWQSDGASNMDVRKQVADEFTSAFEKGLCSLAAYGTVVRNKKELKAVCDEYYFGEEDLSSNDKNLISDAFKNGRIVVVGSVSSGGGDRVSSALYCHGIGSYTGPEVTIIYPDY